ncbi:unnamed protein product, partial [Allacma fusca]
VQHERGPRKGKHGKGESMGSGPVSTVGHHHHHSSSSAIASTAVSLVNGMDVSGGFSLRNGAPSVISSSGSGAPSVASSSSVSLIPSASSAAAAAAAAAHLTIHSATQHLFQNPPTHPLESTHPFNGAAVAGPLLVHPSAGLLQILMAAERCQEFVWGPRITEGSVGSDRIVHSSPLITWSPSWEALQETSARLLFMAVRWVKCLGPFQTLSKRDQLLLLSESWKELFLLHLAQWSVPLDLPALLGTPKAQERFPKDPLVLQDIKAIQEIMGRFRQLSPDGSECGCMKAIILLKP